MMIFIKKPSKMLVVPEQKLNYIQQCDKEIVITYQTGESIWLDDTHPAEKQEQISLRYVDTDECLKVMQDFYKAVMQNKAAFCFVEN